MLKTLWIARILFWKSLSLLVVFVVVYDLSFSCTHKHVKRHAFMYVMLYFHSIFIHFYYLCNLCIMTEDRQRFYYVSCSICFFYVREQNKRRKEKMVQNALSNIRMDVWVVARRWPAENCIATIIIWLVHEWHRLWFYMHFLSLWIWLSIKVVSNDVEIDPNTQNDDDDDDK